MKLQLVLYHDDEEVTECSSVVDEKSDDYLETLQYMFVKLFELEQEAMEEKDE